MPTAAQIEAAFREKSYAVSRLLAGVWTPLNSSDVISIDGIDHATTGNRDNPLTAGEASLAGADITLRSTTALAAVDWLTTPVRIELGFFGSNDIAFEGVVESEDWDSDARSIPLRLTGYWKLLDRCKLPTDLVMDRRAFTQTTIASVEDPAHPACQSGWGNRVAFDAGGRPYEQDFLYMSDPNRTFWYSFQTALLEIPYAWARSGESHWECLLEAARAAGGQIVQGQDGVIRYWSPFRVTDQIPVSPWHLHDGLITGNVTRSRTDIERVGTQIVKYTERAAFPRQQMWALDRMRIVPAGNGSGSTVYGTLDIPIETQYPLLPTQLAACGLARGQVVPLAQWLGPLNAKGVPQPLLTDFANAPITVARNGATGNTVHYVVTQSSAQNFTLQVRNSWPRPIQIHAWHLDGFPVMAVRTGEARAGSGAPEATWEENMLIQCYDQAERFAQMSLAFAPGDRPVVAVEGVRYDPRRFLGEWIEFSWPVWGWAHVPCMIIGRQVAEDRSYMRLELIPMTGIPRRDEYYRVGQAYGAVWQKKLVW